MRHEDDPAPTLPVTLIMRQPVPGWHSIETVFATVTKSLPSDLAVSVHTVPCRSTGFVARIINLIDVARLRRRPGLFHVTGDVHYVALALPRQRTVLTIHDLGTLDGPARARRALIALLWFHLPVRWVAAVTVVSEATREALVRLIPGCEDRVVVIPNPLPDDLRARGPRPIASRPRILAVGATPNKNLARLAAAVAPLDVELLIVGAAPVDVVAMFDRGCPGVIATLTVMVDLPRWDLLRQFRDADLLALVSTSEGFGLPVIEAQAVGVPVVASDLPVLVDVTGGAAILVDPMDVSSIRDGMVRAITDQALRDRLVVDGAANVRRFGPSSIAAAYAQCYRELVRLTGREA